MSGEERERLLAEALAEFHDRGARGEAVSIAEFCRRFPVIAEELAEELEVFASLAETQPQTEELARLSGHKIIRELGHGGMGRVYLAHDERLDRQVAIKVLSERYQSNERVRKRFLEEARTLAKLRHPGIVTIFDLGPDSETPHFVMEYIEGLPLTAAARQLDMRAKATLFRRVLLAVEFLHGHRFLHRDLKPGNILVDAQGDTRLLDFGLALPLEELDGRMTLPGEIPGTPYYLSPEQARGEQQLDARSDVFALGILLYELIAGVLPFRQPSLPEQLRSIAQDEPELPARRNPAVPAPLQDICMQALEKDPRARYTSVEEMRRDIERFLAGEPVLAAPASYGRRMENTLRRHISDIDAWRREHLLLPAEHDRLQAAYQGLAEREDAWILEARRLSLSQVALYFGSWMLVAGAMVAVLLRQRGFEGWPSVLLVSLACVPSATLGLRYWKQRQLRVAIGFLLTFCILLPAALLLAMVELGLFAGRGPKAWELFDRYSTSSLLRRPANAQLWWALLFSFPTYAWLRRYTRSSVFSFVAAAALSAWSLVTLMRFGLLDWLAEDPGRAFLWLTPVAAGFFALALLLEKRSQPLDSRYFYPLGVAFTLIGLSGVASFHDGYAAWWKATFPVTRGQPEYLFLTNASLYYLLQLVCDWAGSDQLRRVGKAFRFVLPGHVMGSIFFLGLEASKQPAHAAEARFFQILLPAVAALFVFGSISKQMKNFFATGLIFFGLGVARLAWNLLREEAWWPLALVLAGLAVMLAAANFTALRLRLKKIF